jgi:hypothetical protein
MNAIPLRIPLVKLRCSLTFAARCTRGGSVGDGRLYPSNGHEPEELHVRINSCGDSRSPEGDLTLAWNLCTALP